MTHRVRNSYFYSLNKKKPKTSAQLRPEWCSKQSRERGTSLVVQWLRICLPMQGMRVRSMVREERSHMIWGNWARAPQLKSLCALKPVLHNEQPMPCNEDPPQPKTKQKNKVEGVWDVSAVPFISWVLKKKIHFDEHLPFAFLILGALSLLLLSHPSLVLFLADYFFNKFIYLFSGCNGSSLLGKGFL